MLQEHVKTTKTDKTRFSLLKKTILLPDKQLFINVLFRSKSSPITVTRTKKVWKESKYGINVSISYWLLIWARCSFFKSFFSISTYCQPVNLQSTHGKLWSSQSWTTDSRFWSRFFYYCSEWSRSKKTIRNTLSCLAYAVVSKATVLEQPSSVSSSYP